MKVHVSDKLGTWPALIAVRYFLTIIAYYLPFKGPELFSFISLREFSILFLSVIVCETNYGLSSSGDILSRACNFCSSINGLIMVKQSL